MRDEILNNPLGRILNIHIPPVNPTMLRAHGRTQQIVPRAAHRLPPRPLRRKPMPVLHILSQRDAEIFLDDLRAAEGDAVRPRLHPLQLHGQDGEGVVRAVADEEGEVDEVVGVGELGEEVEVLFDVGRGVAERGEDEDALFVDQRLGGGVDGVEVDALDGGAVDLDRGVVVEDDGRLEVAGPLCLFGCRHLHGRFCRAKAVESVVSINQPSLSISILLCLLHPVHIT